MYGSMKAMTAFCSGRDHGLWKFGYGASCAPDHCWSDFGEVACGMEDCLIPGNPGLGWAVCARARCSGSKLTGGGAGPLTGAGLGVGEGRLTCAGCGAGTCGTYFRRNFLLRLVACLEPLIMTV